MWDSFLVIVLCVSTAFGQKDPPLPAPSVTSSTTGSDFVSVAGGSSSTSLPVTVSTDAQSTTFFPTGSPAVSSSVTFPVVPPSPLPPGAGTPIDMPTPSPTQNFLVGVANEALPEGAQLPPHAGIPVEQDEEEHVGISGPEHAPMPWPNVPPPFYGHHPFAGMPPPGSEFGHFPFHMAGMPMNFPPGMNMSGMGNMPFPGPMPGPAGGMHPHMPWRSMQPMMFPPMHMGPESPDLAQSQMRPASRSALRRMGVSLMEPRALMMGSLVKVIQGTPVNGIKNKSNTPGNSIVPLPVQMGTPTNTTQVSANSNQTTISPTLPVIGVDESGGQQGHNQHLTRSMLPSLSVDL